MKDCKNPWGCACKEASGVAHQDCMYYEWPDDQLTGSDEHDKVEDLELGDIIGK